MRSSMYLLSLNLSSFISINFYFFSGHDNFSSYQFHCLSTVIVFSLDFPPLKTTHLILLVFVLFYFLFINLQYFFYFNLFYFFSFNFYIFLFSFYSYFSSFHFIFPTAPEPCALVTLVIGCHLTLSDYIKMIT